MLGTIKKPLQALRRSMLHRRERSIDGRRGIATTVKLNGENLDLNAECIHYEPLQYSVLDELDVHLRLGEGDVIYDLGCGQGRVICHYASKGVGSVVGVEYDPDLAQAARANVDRMKGRVASVRVIEGDAAAVDYNDATVIFMYNPFGADTMRRVLARLPAKKGLRVVYANPAQMAVFGEFPQLREVARFMAPYNLHRMGVVIWERT